jgi:hypothetical protein
MSIGKNMMGFSDEQIERMEDSFNNLEGPLMIAEFNNVQIDSKNYHS